MPITATTLQRWNFPITVEGAAELLGCERENVLRLCREGKLKHTRVTKRHIRILPEWLREVRPKDLAPPEPKMKVPPPPRATPFIGNVVYFVEAKSANLIKIGWSGYVSGRLKGLCAGSPIPLRLLGCIPGDVNLERKLHEQFAKERRHGEWFRATDRLLEFIASVIAEEGLHIDV